MTRPWRCIDTATTNEGELKCLARGEPPSDYMITVDGRVLMVSHAARSEEALAQLAREAAKTEGGSVLVGGLGMGYTLRAALEAWPAPARVVVAELNPVVVDWCRGPLASLSGGALDDPRVALRVDDVQAVIGEAGTRGGDARFSAILLDLYEGPNEASRGSATQRSYTVAALRGALAALRPGGALAIWSEAPDKAFERRVRAAGLSLAPHHPDTGARRHTIYLISAAAT